CFHARPNPLSATRFPYTTLFRALPIDPADLSRGYEAVVRVNSQSGKGGVAFVLQQKFGLELPRRLQIEFSRVVKQFTDREGREATSADIYALFEQEYLQRDKPFHLVDVEMVSHGGERASSTEVVIDYREQGKARRVSGTGSGAIEAAVSAIGGNVRVIDYHEHALGKGS